MDASASPEPIPTSVLSQARSSFREVPWRWSDVLIGFAPLLLQRAVYRLMDPATASAAPMWLWAALAVLAEVWMLAYPLAVARRRGISARLPSLRSALVETLLALLVLIPVLAAMVAGSLAITYFFGESVLPAGPTQPLGDSPSRSEWSALLILAVVVAPVGEEVFFRGLFYSALRRRIHLAFAVPLQAAVFGLLHPFGLGYATVIAIVGVFLAVVYEWRKTLLTPILLHSLVNIVAMTVMTADLAATAAAPVLGVEVNAHEGGCLVTAVVANSAAAEADLRAGDVIVTVDGQPVANLRGLRMVLRARRAGDRVSIDYIRNGESYRVEALLRRGRSRGLLF